jgi:hypothetical protein
MNASLKRFPLWAGKLGIFTLVFAFYLYTLAPSVNWADGARIQMDAVLGGSSYASFEELADIHTDGLPFDRLGVAAWDHPLYVMLGRLFLFLPIGEPAYRLNWMSAFIGALGVAVVYALGVYLTGNRFAALLGGLALAVSHTFWFHAVTTEVYTLHLLLMAIEIGLALHWVNDRRPIDLTLFALVAGLGIANHRLFAITSIVSAVYMLLTWARELSESRRLSLAGLRDRFAGSQFFGRAALPMAAFVSGFAPWWVQFIRMSRILGAPLTLRLAFTFSLIEKRLSIASWTVLFENLGIYLAWLLYQFMPLGVGLGVYGFYQMWRARPALGKFLIALFVAYVAFSANFSIADQFSHHLSSFLVFDFGLIWGLSSLIRSLEERFSSRWSAVGMHASLLVLVLALPPLVYTLIPAALRRAAITEADFGIYQIGLGVRDTFDYFLNPNKRGDDSAARFGRSTLEQLPSHAIVFTPKTSEQEAYVVLRYFQLVEGMRPDVRLEMMLFDPLDDMPQAVLSRLTGLAGCRPLYFTSLNPASFPVVQVLADFDLVPEANLYRLQPRQRVLQVTPCENLDTITSGLSLDELIRRALRWQ